jgi:hypothetical protein
MAAPLHGGFLLKNHILFISRNKGKLDRPRAMRQYPKLQFVKIYIGGIAMPQKFADRVKMAMEKESIATYAELSQQPV